MQLLVTGIAEDPIDTVREDGLWGQSEGDGRGAESIHQKITIDLHTTEKINSCSLNVTQFVCLKWNMSWQPVQLPSRVQKLYTSHVHIHVIKGCLYMCILSNLFG